VDYHETSAVLPATRDIADHGIVIDGHPAADFHDKRQE
jgi:hypothetical protein